MAILISAGVFICAVVLGLLVLPWIFELMSIYFQWVEKTIRRNK